MSRQDAKAAGEDWVRRHWPEDLKGRLVQFASFEDDETCRFFHPPWSNVFQRMVVTGSARLARKRGAKTTYKTVTIQDYLTWLQGNTDSPEQRKQFIESITIVIN